MDAPRVLPPIVILLLLTTSLVPAPAAAQDPRLDLPTEARSLQWAWIQELDRDLTRDSARYQLQEQDRRFIQQGFNDTLDAYRNNRWDGTLRTILGLGPLPTYIHLDRVASNTNRSAEEVYLGHMDPIFQQALRDSSGLRTRINETMQSVETREGLEYLYLASMRLVQGNENLRQYPQYRSLVQASGNRTPANMYQTLVTMPMGAQRSYEMGHDLVNQSIAADAEASSPPVDATKVRLAWTTMDARVGNQSGGFSQRGAIQDSLDKTSSREEWLVSTALGQVYVASAQQGELNQALQQGRANRSSLARAVATELSNTTLLSSMVDHGFPGILQRDVLAYASTTFRSGASTSQLVSVLASLAAIHAATDSLVAVAEASPQRTEVAPQDDGLSPVQLAVLGAGAGALVGAAAVALFLKQRDAL